MVVLEDGFWKRFKIYENVEKHQWEDWKWQIANRLKTLEDVEKVVPLSNQLKEAFEKTTGVFHFGTTPYYFSLIKEFSYRDPVFKQIFPHTDEIDEKKQKAGKPDPFLEDLDLSPVEGITHKYPDRVLFRATNFCDVYCRHCMRKRIFLEEERARTKEEYEKMFDYIRKNKNIREVLISGGDPLTLPNKKLEFIIKNLHQIDHIDIIRIGSRTLVSNPYRFFDEELLEIFDKYDKVWFVSHFNHPNEITNITKRAVKNILSTGTPVLNQTVLMKDVNDDEKTIEELMRDLLKVKIKPYYLFYCDPVKGVMHFRADFDKGIEIIRHLRGRVSGLATPIYAVDLENGLGKVPVFPDYIVERGENYIVFENFEGKKIKQFI